MMVRGLGLPTLGEVCAPDVAALAYLFHALLPFPSLGRCVCVFEVRRSSSNLRKCIYFQHPLLPLLAVHRCSQKWEF